MAHPTTCRPIERAEPSIIFIADFDRVAVEIDDLLLGDLPHLLLRHLADEAAAWRLGAGGRLLADLEVRRLLEEEGHRRLAHLEGERAVLIGGDDDRDRRALLQLRGARIESLAEFHDVEAALAKRGTDRRRRIGRACRHLQFDIAGDFLSHEAAPCAGAAARGCPEGCARLQFVVRTLIPAGDRAFSHVVREGAAGSRFAGRRASRVRSGDHVTRRSV